jgi:hypothetical protein
MLAFSPLSERAADGEGGDMDPGLASTNAWPDARRIDAPHVEFWRRARSLGSVAHVPIWVVLGRFASSASLTATARTVNLGVGVTGSRGSELPPLACELSAISLTWDRE